MSIKLQAEVDKLKQQVTDLQTLVSTLEKAVQAVAPKKDTLKLNK